MLGLLLYVILSCIIQLHVANCGQQNSSQTTPATSTPTEMLTSTTVQSSKTIIRSSLPPAHSEASDWLATDCNFFDKCCRPLLLMVGGLIIACTVLILSTLVLALKVCLLSQRVSAQSGSADLISQTECTRGTVVKKSSQSEIELREGTMLMADHLHEGQGGPEEEEEEEEEEEATANEDKAEEVEEAAKREEASAAPTENSSSPVPQEEPAKADSTAEGTEKPKDEV